MKTKLIYSCNECGSQSSKWLGQCPDCGAWNSLQEERATKKSSRAGGYAAETLGQVLNLEAVDCQEVSRTSSGLSELDRVLGGGLVAGAVVLIGGDPGIGKSTLLIQTMSELSKLNKALYITGEESLQQVTMRAKRLGLSSPNLRLLAETQVERIIQLAKQEKPQVMVVDSIQTLFSEAVSSAPGAVSQVRESAAQLVRFAKMTNTALFLVGHVTKEGALAGPRVLEHMVDSVLYFEGQTDSRFRVIRAVKNRFGAVNELGVFAMTDKGLREISNPSAIFLSRYGNQVAGSCVMVTWEGSRPLLVEVQALVDDSHHGNPRRLALGLDQNRLAMLLAVLHRHAGVASHDQDVFINVVGGMRVTEPAIDLALLLAVVSSLRDQPLAQDLVIFGEVGLAGEIRPVQSGQERLREAHKHGFKMAIIPKANAPKNDLEGMKVCAIGHLSEAFEYLR